MEERSSYSQKSVQLHDDDVINHVDLGKEDDDQMNADECARCETVRVTKCWCMVRTPARAWRLRPPK